MTDAIELQIRHHTGFKYTGLDKSSYNEARMTPRTLEFQDVTASRVNVRPVVPTYTYTDYFGTIVTAFDIGEVHDVLEVESLTTVLTRPATRGAAMDWAELHNPLVADRMVEYLGVSARTRAPEAALVRCDEWRGVHDIHEVAESVGAFVRENMSYVPGSTNVTSTAADAWANGKGVCQDMTHVTLGILRSMGIPARYVSGYFYSKKVAEIGEVVRGQSHAWVEYFTGEWCGFDPTNGVGHTERHVVVGRGRDYGDVSPLKGIYQGPSSTGTGAVVEIQRLS